jgi:hypothetical protein
VIENHPVADCSRHSSIDVRMQSWITPVHRCTDFGKPMKNILASTAMMAFASVAFAQPPMHPKAAGAAHTNLPGAAVNSGGVTNSTVVAAPKAGNAASPQNNAGTKGVNAAPNEGGNANRTVCRTVGSTVYYCN